VGSDNLSIKLYILCLILFDICFVSISQGAFEDDFLGAKSMAMGGAYTALADEADGALVNPAGLSMVEKHQIVAAAAALYAGLSEDPIISQNILGYAYKQGNIGNFGVAWKRLTAGELYSENIVALSVARDFRFYFRESEEERRKNLSLGVSLNIMNWDSGPTVGSDGRIVEDLPGWRGFGINLGLVIWASENIPVALSFQNINMPDIASDVSAEDERLPLKARMGVAAISENINWAMDMIFSEGELDLRVGLERRYDPTFRIRAGFSLENLAWGTNFTLGAGYYPTHRMRIDYAFVYPINTILDTLGSHRVSITYNFGN
jgi:hypothetical protein